MPVKFAWKGDQVKDQIKGAELRAVEGEAREILADLKQELVEVWERNVLSAGENCNGCIAEDARGWVPLGDLIPIFHRFPCREHCHCHLEFAERPAGDKAFATVESEGQRVRRIIAGSTSTAAQMNEVGNGFTRNTPTIRRIMDRHSQQLLSRVRAEIAAAAHA